MNVIKNLYELTRRLSSRRHSLVDASFREDAQYARLLNIVLVNPEATESELNEQIHTALGGSWRTTKYRLVNKLVDILYLVHLNPDKHEELTVAEFRCQKLLFAMHVCRRFGKYAAAIHLARRILGTAGKFDITHAALQAVTVLRDVNILTGDVRAAEKAAEQHRLLFEIYCAETELAEAWAHLQILSSQHLTLGDEDCKKVEQICQQYTALVVRKPTHRLMKYYHLSQGFVYRVRNQINLALEHYCLLFEFSRKRYPKMAWRACFDVVRCATLDSYYSIGDKYINYAEGLQNSNSFNWFQFNAAAFLFYLRFDRARARELFERTVDHPDWRKRAERVEVWRVFEAYLRLLAPQAPPAVSAFAGGFSFSELNKEFEFCRRDKNGLNIALPLVRICWARRLGFYSVAENHWNNLTNYLRTNGRELDRRFARLRVLLAHLGRLLRSEQSPRGADGMIDGGPHEELAEIGRIDGPMYEEIAPFEQLWTALAEEPRPSASARHNRKGRS